MSFLLRSLFCIGLITVIAGERDGAKLRNDLVSATKTRAASAYALLCEGREAKCLAKAAEIAASLDRQGGKLPVSQDTLTRADKRTP